MRQVNVTDLHINEVRKKRRMAEKAMGKLESYSVSVFDVDPIN